MRSETPTYQNIRVSRPVTEYHQSTSKLVAAPNNCDSISEYLRISGVARVDANGVNSEDCRLAVGVEAIIGLDDKCATSSVWMQECRCRPFFENATRCGGKVKPNGPWIR
jgi:hypothetical protein